MMNRVIVIENSALAPPGRLWSSFERNGFEVQVVRPYTGDPLPMEQRPAGWVILGAEYGAYHSDRYPFLDDEAEIIRQAIAQDIPLLGICLGAQLIANSMGGQAYRSPQAEAGVLEVVLTEPGQDDPVIGSMGSSVFTVHQDTFELPPEAILLAETSRYPQAFRLGSALGLQFHPETPASVGIGWGEELSDLLKEAGITFSTYSQTLLEAEKLLETEAAGLFDRWLSSRLIKN